jgi:hypothetical protein
MLHTLLRRDLMPDVLRQSVLASADPEWVKGSAKDPDRKVLAREYMDRMVASFVLYVLPPGGETWERVTMTPDDIATTDQRDIDAIDSLLLRMVTPAQVSAASRRILGLPPEPDDDEEVAVEDLVEFRDQPSGPEHGQDGEAVGAAAEPVAGAVG